MKISDLLTGNIWSGIAVGAGLLVAPVVIPLVASAVQPILKTALKGGMIVYAKGQELLAEAGEMLEDTYAEAVSEIAQDITDKNV